MKGDEKKQKSVSTNRWFDYPLGKYLALDKYDGLTNL